MNGCTCDGKFDLVAPYIHSVNCKRRQAGLVTIEEMELREKIAHDIEEASKAGKIQSDTDFYWVAGMQYAAKIARK